MVKCVCSSRWGGVSYATNLSTRKYISLKILTKNLLTSFVILDKDHTYVSDLLIDEDNWSCICIYKNTSIFMVPRTIYIAVNGKTEILRKSKFALKYLTEP